MDKKCSCTKTTAGIICFILWIFTLAAFAASISLIFEKGADKFSFAAAIMMGILGVVCFYFFVCLVKRVQQVSVFSDSPEENNGAGIRKDFPINSVDSKCLSRLPLYAQRFFEALKPVLTRVSVNKIDRDKTRIAIEANGKSWELNITVCAKDERISQLDISASRGRCILSLAESEYIEDHRVSEEDWDSLTKEVVFATERYLSGVTTLEYYDKKDVIFKKIFYFGMDTETKKENIIGTVLYGFHFFKKPQRIEKIAYSFIQ